MTPARIEPAGKKLEKANEVEHAKKQLDKAKTNFDNKIVEALEHGVTRAEIARRANMTETAIYKKVKRMNENKKKHKN
ncbi:MAG: AsnC family protein [Micrococcaceae bacterium]